MIPEVRRSSISWAWDNRVTVVVVARPVAVFVVVVVLSVTCNVTGASVTKSTNWADAYWAEKRRAPRASRSGRRLGFMVDFL